MRPTMQFTFPNQHPPRKAASGSPYPDRASMIDPTGRAGQEAPAGREGRNPGGRGGRSATVSRPG